MTIKAILFDMDGVLIDAREWHYDALNDALRLFGYTISRESHLTTYDGLPTRVKLNLLSTVSNFPMGLHEIVNSVKQQNTIKYAYKNCKPVFHHQRALSKLSQNYKLGVCSNSIKPTITSMLSLAQIIDYFDLILSSQDVEKPKPNPEIYNKAISYFGYDPNECLIIEDNDHGYQAATASNANVLRISSPEDLTLKLIENKLKEIS